MAEDRFEKVRRLTREDREEIFDAAMERSDEIRNGAMCGSEEDDEESWERNRLLQELRAERSVRLSLRGMLSAKILQASNPALQSFFPSAKAAYEDILAWIEEFEKSRRLR